LNASRKAGKKLPMSRASLALLLPMVLLLGCSKPEAPQRPAGPAAWTDARSLKLAMATLTSGSVERLELRHEPIADAEHARLKLVLLTSDGERVLVDETVPLAQRDAAWSARCLLVAEPPPGARRAISIDGGASWLTLLPLPGGKLQLCPHKKVAAVGGTPDWPMMLTAERWATGVLETAVWRCDEAGAHCLAGSQVTGMTVHHSEPDADVLVVSHEEEMHAAIAVFETLAVDRFLGAALLDAAVTRQRGLDQAELEKLGRHAAKALGPQGPFTVEQRKAMRLRVLMARDEAKKTAKDQLSPRASVAALIAALEDLPQEIPAGR